MQEPKRDTDEQLLLKSCVVIVMIANLCVTALTTLWLTFAGYSLNETGINSPSDLLYLVGLLTIFLSNPIVIIFHTLKYGFYFSWKGVLVYTAWFIICILLLFLIF